MLLLKNGVRIRRGMSHAAGDVPMLAIGDGASGATKCFVRETSMSAKPLKLKRHLGYGIHVGTDGDQMWIYRKKRHQIVEAIALKPEVVNEFMCWLNAVLKAGKFDDENTPEDI